MVAYIMFWVAVSATVIEGIDFAMMSAMHYFTKYFLPAKDLESRSQPSIFPLMLFVGASVAKYLGY